LCFKKTIEMLKNDRTHRFKEGLLIKAKQTMDLPALPPLTPNLTPIIRFNMKGHPDFEFYFLSKNSPVMATEVLKIDQQIVDLSKTIYEWIILPQRKSSSKGLTYNRRQLEFNN